MMRLFFYAIENLIILVTSTVEESLISLFILHFTIQTDQPFII